MSDVELAIVENLKRLRKGHGVLSVDLDGRITQDFRQLFSATADSGDELRARLVAYLEDLVLPLPEQLTTVVRVALNLPPVVDRQRKLEQRKEHLAEQFCCDTRTIVRRIDEAFDLMAHNAVRDHGMIVALGARDQGWYVDVFDAVLRLDQPAPEAIERSTIVVTARNLDRIVTSTDVPRHPEDRGTNRGLSRELMFGGLLEDSAQSSPTHFRTAITLPRTLGKDSRHTYCLISRIPEGQPMAPHYVCVPDRACRHFTLLVRFHSERVPARVWKLDGVPYRTIDERIPTSDLLVPDRAAEVSAQFRDLKPNHGYGIQWSDE
ncbi:hypothetical protein F0L68_17705 [Solihabitans fulvus]|uniref:Uncharacterized protein n=1 Tax=Solihabitans fulvus TaxID=1892852 RepID=A0A5B2XC54_9PSEU|nr:hypothetical protein [Solihabitans fulvus]KAA2261288.1 hypothetical protein F0L68_17705 [Solihabitans fulvus]